MFSSCLFFVFLAVDGFFSLIDLSVAIGFFSFFVVRICKLFKLLSQNDLWLLAHLLLQLCFRCTILVLQQ